MRSLRLPDGRHTPAANVERIIVCPHMFSSDLYYVRVYLRGGHEIDFDDLYLDRANEIKANLELQIDNLADEIPAYDNGYQDGRRDAWNDGHAAGRNEGWQSGFEEGVAQGKNEPNQFGYSEGFQSGAARLQAIINHHRELLIEELTLPTTSDDRRRSIGDMIGLLKKLSIDLNE